MNRPVAHDITKTNFLRATARSLLLGTATSVILIAANQQASADFADIPIPFTNIYVCVPWCSGPPTPAPARRPSEPAPPSALQLLVNNGSLSQQMADHLISQDGAGLISQDGAGLARRADVQGAIIAQRFAKPPPDGLGLMSQAQANSLISQDGAGLISQDGAGLTAALTKAGVASPSAALIAKVISNDGGSLLPRLAAAIVASGGGNIISEHGAGLVGNAGGTLVGPSGGTYSVMSSDGTPNQKLDNVLKVDVTNVNKNAVPAAAQPTAAQIAEVQKTQAILALNTKVQADQAALQKNPNDPVAIKNNIADSAQLSAKVDPTGKTYATAAAAIAQGWQQNVQAAQDAATKQSTLVASDFTAWQNAKTSAPDVAAQLAAKYQTDLAALDPLVQTAQQTTQKAQAALTSMQPYAKALSAAGGAGSPEAKNAIAAISSQPATLANSNAGFTSKMTTNEQTFKQNAAQLPVVGQTPAQADAAANLAAQAAAAAAKQAALNADLAVAQGKAVAAQGAASAAQTAATSVDNAYAAVTASLGNRPTNLADRLTVDKIGADKGVADAARNYITAYIAYNSAVAAGASQATLRDLSDARAASNKALMFQEDMNPGAPLPPPPPNSPPGFFPVSKGVNDANGNPILYYAANARANFADGDLQSAKTANTAAQAALAALPANADPSQRAALATAATAATILQAAAQDLSDKYNADAQIVRLTASHNTDGTQIKALQAVSAAKQQDLAAMLFNNPKIAGAVGLTSAQVASGLPPTAPVTMGNAITTLVVPALQQAVQTANAASAQANTTLTAAQTAARNAQNLAAAFPPTNVSTTAPTNAAVSPGAPPPSANLSAPPTPSPTGPVMANINALTTKITDMSLALATEQAKANPNPTLVSGWQKQIDTATQQIIAGGGSSAAAAVKQLQSQHGDPRYQASINDAIAKLSAPASSGGPSPAAAPNANSLANGSPQGTAAGAPTSISAVPPGNPPPGTPTLSAAPVNSPASSIGPTGVTLTYAEKMLVWQNDIERVQKVLEAVKIEHQAAQNDPKRQVESKQLMQRIDAIDQQIVSQHAVMAREGTPAQQATEVSRQAALSRTPSAGSANSPINGPSTVVTAPSAAKPIETKIEAPSKVPEVKPATPPKEVKIEAPSKVPEVKPATPPKEVKIEAPSKVPEIKPATPPKPQTATIAPKPATVPPPPKPAAPALPPHPAVVHVPVCHGTPPVCS